MKQVVKYTLVYGLSADPIHQRHVDLMVDGAKAIIGFGYDIVRLLIIPVYRRNPVGTKPRDGLLANFEHRFAMCQLVSRDISQAIRGYTISVEVSRIEQRLVQSTEKPNYTVETLQTLRGKEAAGTEFVLLLGSDLVSGDDPELSHWHAPERLVQMATLAIFPRPKYQVNEAFLKDLKRLGASILRLSEVNLGDISARRIRRRLAAGEDPLALSRERLVPESVALYIKKNALYQTVDRGK